MGLFGLTRFIHEHKLVKPSIISTPPGVLTPVAVDVWNVMYTLLERLYPVGKRENLHGPSVTIHCLGVLLRLLTQRSYYPIFVLERCTDGPLSRGAKAIMSRAMNHDERGTSDLTRVLLSSNTSCSIKYNKTSETYDSVFQNSSASCIPSEENKSQDMFLDGCPRQTDKMICLRDQNVCSLTSTMPSRGHPNHRLYHKLCASLIRWMGYAYVEAVDIEADEACANLFHTRTVALVYTTDTDLLFMGCDILLDAIPMFAPVVRCRDLLQYLGITYPEFLVAFVRCQTDLHTSDNLKSVQQVIQDTGLKIPHQMDTSTRSPTYDSWRHGEVFKSLTVATSGKTENGVTVSKYASNRSEVTVDASWALNLLPPSSSPLDNLERAFVEHIIAVVTPLTRGRLKLMKRVNIMQNTADPYMVINTLYHNLKGEKMARQYARIFKQFIPTPLPLNTVLTKYWN
uniref:Virion host shutoff protein n=1 Tax=Human herpesvirus 3 TaxID=10335 RepID=I7DJA1_HHV3|nr:host shut-off factor [Human alphaherpesvirus 3]